MSREDRLAELLERWEEASTQEKSFTPDDFCRDCPELLPDFRKILGQLAPINAVLVGKGVVDAAADENAPDIDAGRYKPVSFHARGGLGLVFLAEDAEIGRSVALKCMQRLAATDSGSRRRFLVEAEITGRLEHPGIVPVYGLGQDAHGKPYYAMRFIHGETLGDAAERFHKNTSLDVGERNVGLRRLLRHFVAVCETMAYAHSRGVVHRDLKPANIMIGPYGETLVVDWGLAKQSSAPGEEAHSAISDSSSENFGDSMPGHAKGTPAYMSPEQARGEWDRVGPASDIYSLGSTLFVLLTGKRPYDGRNVREVIDMVKLGAFFAPRTLNPAVPKALDAICRKAMAFRQEDRYADARDLANDLERWLADEPVSAYREPFAIRARRWLKRHRTLVTSASAALIVGMTALGALAVQQRQNNLALQDKNDKLREKNDELIESNVKVEKNFGYARQAVKDMVEQAIGNPLLRRPGLIRFKEALLKKARDYYTNFLANQKADDPEVQEELALSHLFVGYIAQETGVDAAAREEYRLALAIYDRLDMSATAPKERRANGAAVLVRLGLIECDRGNPEGFGLLKRGIAELEKLRRDHPEERLYPASLAIFHAESAARFDLAGRTDEAAEALDRSQIMFGEAMKGLAAGQNEFRFMAAGILADLAGMRFRAGRIREGIELSDRAGKAVDDLLTIDSENFDYRYLGWLVGIARAEVLVGLGKFDEARELCERALPGLKREIDANPESAGHRFLFARACFGAADALRRMHRLVEAAQRYEDARAAFAILVADSPDNLQYKLNLGNACQHLSLVERDRKLPEKAVEALAEARRQYADLYRIQPDQPTFQLNMAIIENSEGMFLLKSTSVDELSFIYLRLPQVLCHAAALSHFERGFAHAKKLTTEHPNNPHYRFMHAMVLRNLGVMSQALGHCTEGATMFEQSRDALAKLAKEHPEIPEFMHESERSLFALANGYNLCGTDQFNAFKPTDVTNWFAKVRPIIDDLLNRDSKNKEYVDLNENNLSMWCLVLRQLAVEEFETKNYAKGLVLFERALPLARKLQAAKPVRKDWPALRSKILVGTGLMCGDRLSQLDRSKPDERKEMIRVANLGIEVFNEASPVDFAPFVQQLKELRDELSKPHSSSQSEDSP